jgi:hypothetical protein
MPYKFNPFTGNFDYTTGSGTLSLPLTGGILTGSLSVSSDLTVGGSLYLQGSSYTVTTSYLSVANPVIYLSQSNPGDNFDIGFVGHNVVNSVYGHTGLLRTHNIGNPGVWYLFSSMATEPSANSVASNNKVIDTLVANVSGDGSKLFNLDSTKLTGLSANYWNSTYNNTVVSKPELVNTTGVGTVKNIVTIPYVTYNAGGFAIDPNTVYILI